MDSLKILHDALSNCDACITDFLETWPEEVRESMFDTFFRTSAARFVQPNLESILAVLVSWRQLGLLVCLSDIR